MQLEHIPLSNGESEIATCFLGPNAKEIPEECTNPIPDGSIAIWEHLNYSDFIKLVKNKNGTYYLEATERR
jgi:hypothetical protein